jgi:DNA-binding response OmpR family regulator
VSPARILVADDEPDMRALLASVLRRAGYDVDQAEDGQAAIEAARARRPDLVIADILMPRVDGWQLCYWLRQDPATAGVPIIFLSLRSRAPDRTYGLKLGADDFVAKPFDPRELVARVQAVLKRTAAAGVRPVVSGISGSLRDMSLIDIAQVLDLGRKTAAVRVQLSGGSGEGIGSLHFEAGSLTHAACGGLVGAPALARLLVLDDGHFEIVLGGRAPRRTLSGSTQTLLLEALRQVDEARAAASSRSRPAPTSLAAPGPRPPAAGTPPRGTPDTPKPGTGPAAPPAATRPAEAPGTGATSDLAPLQPTLLDLFALGVIEPKR